MATVTPGSRFCLARFPPSGLQVLGILWGWQSLALYCRGTCHFNWSEMVMFLGKEYGEIWIYHLGPWWSEYPEQEHHCLTDWEQEEYPQPPRLHHFPVESNTDEAGSLGMRKCCVWEDSFSRLMMAVWRLPKVQGWLKLTAAVQLVGCLISTTSTTRWQLPVSLYLP
jgi:hypothetical protein